SADQNSIQANFNAIFQDPFSAKGALADAQGTLTAYGAFFRSMFGVVNPAGIPFDLTKWKASLPNVKAALADLIADQNNIQANFNAIYQDPLAPKRALADAQGNPTAYGAFVAEMFGVVNPAGIP